ncbi:MAG: Cys-tRNA(Pro) deacylase [Lawsonella sp.]|nr:Cys-tRNA(Pro) deacylase [Mycobacteriales bacterium]
MSKSVSTPALKTVQEAGIPFEVYTYDNLSSDYGAEAADVLVEKLGISPLQIYKTLVIELHQQRSGQQSDLAVAIIPVPAKLDLKKTARQFGAKKATMARIKDAETTTGYVAGGISPFGQRRPLPTLLDTSALQWEKIYVSAGKRGWDIEVAPTDLMQIIACETANLKAD